MAILLVLGRDILNLVLFALMFAAGLSIGNYIFSKFNRNEEKSQGLERFIFSTGLGFGILGYLTLAIGFIGLLYRPIAYFMLFLLLAIGIYLNKHLRLNLKSLARTYIEKFLNLTIFEKILILFILAVSCLNLIAALAPPTGQDVLSSYLVIPRIFFREHRIFYFQENFASNYPILPSILYLFGLMLHSGIIGQLIHCSFGILAAITLYAIAKRYSRTVGLLSSAFFLSLQPVIWESSLALTDLVTVFFLLLAFYAFIKWVSSEEKKWIILAGITGGLAAGCKGLGPIYIGALIILIFINALIRRNFKNALKMGVSFLGSFLIVAAVWYIKAYLMTGNPFFPAFFGGRGITSEWLKGFEKFWFCYTPARNIRSFLLFPIDLTFFYHSYKTGWIGPLFLTYIPLIALCKERTDKIIFNIFSYCLILFVFISFLKVSFFARHFLILFALFSIPVSIAIHRFTNSSELKIFKLPSFIVISIWLGFTFTYATWKKIPTIPSVVGIENKDDYLQRMIPEDVNFMEAFNFINKNLPQDVKILYVGSRGYYLNRDYIRFWRLSTGLLNIKEIETPNDFLKSLRKFRITHILIDYRVAEKQASRLDMKEGYRLLGFLNELILNQNFSIVYQIDRCFLYQM